MLGGLLLPLLLCLLPVLASPNPRLMDRSDRDFLRQRRRARRLARRAGPSSVPVNQPGEQVTSRYLSCPVVGGETFGGQIFYPGQANYYIQCSYSGGTCYYAMDGSLDTGDSDSPFCDGTTSVYSPADPNAPNTYTVCPYYDDSTPPNQLESAPSHLDYDGGDSHLSCHYASGVCRYDLTTGALRDDSSPFGPPCPPNSPQAVSSQGYLDAYPM